MAFVVVVVVVVVCVFCLGGHWESFHFDAGFVCNFCSLFLLILYDVEFCE